MNDLSGSKIDNIDSDIEPNLEIDTEYKNTGRRVSNRSKKWAYRINYYTLGGAPSLLPVIAGQSLRKGTMSEICKKCEREIKYKQDNSPYCLCTYEAQLRKQKVRYDKNTHIMVETISEKSPSDRELADDDRNNENLETIQENDGEDNLNGTSMEDDGDRDSENEFAKNPGCQLFNSSPDRGAFSPGSPANLDTLKKLRLNDTDTLRSGEKQKRNRNYSIVQGNITPDVRKKIIDPDGPLTTPMIEILMDQQNMQEKILRQNIEQRVTQTSPINKKVCKKNKGKLT